MKVYILALLQFICIAAGAQESVHLHIKDSKTNAPVQDVTLSVDNTGAGYTDSAGNATLTLSKGPHTVTCSIINYTTNTVTITVPVNGIVEIVMEPTAADLEEVTIVSSTRNEERIENSPIKVEVLGLEEMNEENTIKPANIASILGDMSGIQIQQSSAVSGNANVRIQGLDGRYTQLLRDGMPLFDGFSGGFGVLQIPPLDLRQIELIKGSASTLYGGGAIGGLINLISKRPTMNQEGVLTLNYSTLQESNANLYLAKRNKQFGYTFFGGVTHQEAVDVNSDGFSDVPKTDAVILHPRLFYYPNEATTVIVGYSGTYEQRNGGDIQAIKGATDSTHQFYEKNDNVRHTGELIAEHSFASKSKLTFKASVSSFDRTIESISTRIKGNQLNYFTELSLYIPRGVNSFVLGINAQGDQFKKLSTHYPIALNDYNNNTIGAFVQNTTHLPYNITLETGLRIDHHDQYGNFVLPRIALFHRFNEAWATRMGVGLGYKTPNPLAVQNTDYALQYIQPLPGGIEAEQSAGYNIEANYKKDLTTHSNIFVNAALFLTEIKDPVIATQQSDNNVTFSNAAKGIVSEGVDIYVKMTVHSVELYAGYTYTHTARKYLTDHQFMPLTPRNRAAFTAVKEIAGKWRFGLEGSYTGSQYRDGAGNTPDYVFIAAMVERKIGKKVSVVLNGENLLDYRQSKYESLYAGTVAHPEFKPLWAPIDGRVINLSIKIMPFAQK